MEEKKEGRREAFTSGGRQLTNVVGVRSGNTPVRAVSEGADRNLFCGLGLRSESASR